MILNVVLNADTGVQRLWLQEVQRNSAAKDVMLRGRRRYRVTSSELCRISDSGFCILDSGSGFKLSSEVPEW